MANMLRKIRSSKKGALELSIGTVVVLVIGMSMLILGLVLVRTIFTGAKYNIDQINQNVEAEINKLFNERGGRTFIYLPNNQADVSKDKTFGVAFGIKNDLEGIATPSTFNYQIKSSSIQTGCQLTQQQADSYLILGSSGTLTISPGSEPVYRLVRIQPSASAPLCEIQYDLIVTLNGQPYDTNFFIVKIK